MCVGGGGCIISQYRQFHSSADTWILCIPHAKTKTLCRCSFSYCAPKQSNFPPSDICQFNPPMPSGLGPKLTSTSYATTSNLKFCLLLHPPPHTHTHTFLLCAQELCVCVCVNVCVHAQAVCKKYNIMFIYHFKVLCIHFVDLYSMVCSQFSLRYGAIYILLSLNTD